ncbi:DapH/DapD/GlmU-related protein [Bacillus cereus group sp. Bc252]|uniref:serine O-acetyltransferase n=1 Tax=Bacillus TaxID=1386 RepID=UPI0021D2C22C|nr:MULTISPECIES: DapH/DapD/GlmU-related protein [Bacillus cereus group]MCU5206736.1 serine acetyltransferase [Bacillus paranthracis]MDA2160284.1 DapH/DapD/GlmU-related protein [Bacillus cereus group sp. Bc252]HDR7786459.1 serine acetyltransferase [Bacillus paranthracis]
MTNKIKEIIKADLFRYQGDTSYKVFVKNLITNEGFKYTYLLRKCQRYRNKKAFTLQYLFYKILLRRYKYKFGYEIPETTNIGKGFYVNHLGGITINHRATIGENVNLTKGVTIGQTNRGKNKGVPTIGNKVWIGANATVVGGIKIGDNVLIAPNSYVNFDVPDNSIVIGNPASIIEKENATQCYINNIV